MDKVLHGGGCETSRAVPQEIYLVHRGRSKWNVPGCGRASFTTEVTRIVDQKPILAPRVNMFEFRLIVEMPLASASPRIL